VCRCWLPLLLLHGLLDDTMVSKYSPPSVISSANQLINAPRLLFYTPAATIFRLATANIFNYIITSSILDRTGSHKNVRMILPAWIFVALVSLIHAKFDSQLVTCSQGSGLVYLISHGRTAIKRENDQSLTVLALASFISMALLLFVLHYDQVFGD